MKKRTPKWHKNKNRPQADTKGLRASINNAFSYLQTTLKAILNNRFSALIGSLLVLLIVVLIRFTNIGNPVPGFKEKTQQLNTHDNYLLRGIVVNCDSIPLEGVSVVVEGYDVESIPTDYRGYFSKTLFLPVAVNEVIIRFIDKNNQEIYKTLYTLDKNSVSEDKVQVYAIPDQYLVGSHPISTYVHPNQINTPS